VQERDHRRSPRGWVVRSDKSVRLPPNSKPEPDDVVARGEIRDYTDHSAGPADVALIVEVAFSSLIEDRVQAGVYAAAGIPVYWIVNLVERQTEVYSDRSPTGVRSRLDFRGGQNVLVMIDGVEVGAIVVADVLPGADRRPARPSHNRTIGQSETGPRDV
jgi:Uma2 family endonuclease